MSVSTPTKEIERLRLGTLDDGVTKEAAEDDLCCGVISCGGGME